MHDWKLLAWLNWKPWKSVIKSLFSWIRWSWGLTLEEFDLQGKTAEITDETANRRWRNLDAKWNARGKLEGRIEVYGEEGQVEMRTNRTSQLGEVEVLWKREGKSADLALQKCSNKKQLMQYLVYAKYLKRSKEFKISEILSTDEIFYDIWKLDWKIKCGSRIYQECPWILQCYSLINAEKYQSLNSELKTIIEYHHKEKYSQKTCLKFSINAKIPWKIWDDWFEQFPKCNKSVSIYAEYIDTCMKLTNMSGPDPWKCFYSVLWGCFASLSTLPFLSSRREFSPVQSNSIVLAHM